MSCKVSFIGLGVMGYPMAGYISKAGHNVTVYNRTKSKAEKWTKEYKGKIAETPEDAAKDSDFVFTCVGNDDDLKEVAIGKKGIFNTIKKNSVYIDNTTASAKVAKELYLKAKNQGVGFLDAPVSGGVKGAEEGTLAILAGGKLEAIEQIRPIVSNLCNRMTHMGHTGAGQVTKLCNQVIVASNLVTIAEAISLAERSGVDATKLHEALAGGFGDSLPLQIFGPRFAERKVKPLLGHIYTMLKDVDNARELGRETNTPLPMAGLAAEMFRQVSSQGYAQEDVSHLIRIFESEED